MTIFSDILQAGDKDDDRRGVMYHVTLSNHQQQNFSQVMTNNTVTCIIRNEYLKYCSKIATDR